MKYSEFLRLARHDHSYSDSKLQSLRRASTYLRSTARILGGGEYDAKPNPGGVAVSGDIRLMVMSTGGMRGFHFFGDGQFGYTIRSITSLRDYTGGPNRSLGFLPDTEQEFLGILASHLR